MIRSVPEWFLHVHAPKIATSITAMEYALIAALIAVAAIAAFTLPARASARLSA